MNNTYQLGLLKKYRKLYTSIIDEFISKHEFKDDLEWVESDRIKVGDIIISLDLILKDFQYNAPKHAILEYMDYRYESDTDRSSYYDFLKGLYAKK